MLLFLSWGIIWGMGNTPLGHYYYLPPRRRPGTGDIVMSVRLSVCPSVTFSFHTVTQKRITVFSWNFCRHVHYVMGVCWIDFDIDWMLFEFFIFWKKIILISCFLRILCYFQHFYKKLFRGGGGGKNGGGGIFFLDSRKTILSHFI